MAIKIPIDIPVNDSKLLKAKKALEELYKLAEKSKKQTMNAPTGCHLVLFSFNYPLFFP